MKQLSEVTLDEKMNFLRDHRSPVNLFLRDSDYYLQIGHFDNGTYHEFQDNSFESLLTRAYCVAEGEFRSWGY